MPCQVEAVKLFVLKTINLATLVYQLFLIQTNANTTQQYLQLPNYADVLKVCLLSIASSGVTITMALQASARMYQHAYIIPCIKFVHNNVSHVCLCVSVRLCLHAQTSYCCASREQASEPRLTPLQDLCMLC